MRIRFVKDDEGLKYMLINPLEAPQPHLYNFKSNLYHFAFGAYGGTHLLVWGGNMDDALEEAADWLAENAPGYLMKHGSEEMDELYKEACENHGVVWTGFKSEINQRLMSAICQDVEADLTYTEAGWLTSYEWWVNGTTGLLRTRALRASEFERIRLERII